MRSLKIVCTCDRVGVRVCVCAKRTLVTDRSLTPIDSPGDVELFSAAVLSFMNLGVRMRTAEILTSRVGGNCRRLATT